MLNAFAMGPGDACARQPQLHEIKARCIPAARGSAVLANHHRLRTFGQLPAITTRGEKWDRVIEKLVVRAGRVAAVLVLDAAGGLSGLGGLLGGWGSAVPGSFMAL